MLKHFLSSLWASRAFYRVYIMRGGREEEEEESKRESVGPSVEADQDKINGSDRECRRQQEIQSRPINNILERQKRPPPQQPLPRSSSTTPVPLAPPTGPP
ncbi:hypothetical protein D5F01_LYC09851 [Xyrichtys novacula]|uniref:Uncharacterized protein n=1 Tax=Xyrichtys novacula TaxID=13765 RepID=A0AAV1G5X7_XYRNO|nr:hypothetical protein D5F01_LYC09851 [Xyrichtys novacula]